MIIFIVVEKLWYFFTFLLRPNDFYDALCISMQLWKIKSTIFKVLLWSEAEVCVETTPGAPKAR